VLELHRRLGLVDTLEEEEWFIFISKASSTLIAFDKIVDLAADWCAGWRSMTRALVVRPREPNWGLLLAVSF
jgi:hypothetical protein